jgi:hypothetical protein
VDCEVKVFPLLVKRQSAIWPEAEQRVVQWVDPEKATSLIREPELKSASLHSRSERPPLRANSFTDRGPLTRLLQLRRKRFASPA